MIAIGLVIAGVAGAFGALGSSYYGLAASRAAVGLGTAAFALCTGPVLAVTIPWATRVLRTTVQRPTEVAACGP